MRCPNGHENPHGMRFCGQCGTPLAIDGESDTQEHPTEVADVGAADSVAASTGEDPDDTASAISSATGKASSPFSSPTGISEPTVDAASNTGTPKRRRWLWVAAVIVIALGVAGVVAVSRGGDELTPVAENACEELEGAIVLQVGGILNRAINDAADAGYSGPELGDKMREICPLTMLAVDNIGEEQEARDALPGQVDLDLYRCGSEDVTGSVTNNSDQRVDIFIEVTFENSNGVQIGDSNASVSGLRPGQKGEWDAYVFDDSYDTCRARISSVFPSD